jgi:hypothetical protein
MMNGLGLVTEICSCYVYSGLWSEAFEQADVQTIALDPLHLAASC